MHFLLAHATRLDRLMDGFQNLGERPLASSESRVDGVAHNGLDVLARGLRLSLEFFELGRWNVDGDRRRAD